MRSLLLFGAVLLLARSGWGEVAVYGRVLDERGAPVPAARLWVTSAPDSQILATATTDSTGSFKLKLNSSGSYLLNARKEGFFEIRQYRFTATEPSVELLLTMNVLREVFQSLDVNGTPSPVDLDQAGTEERLSVTNINAIPFPATDNLRNALRLMPGTIQDPTGRLHFQGGADRSRGGSRGAHAIRLKGCLRRLSRWQRAFADHVGSARRRVSRRMDEYGKRRDCSDPGNSAVTGVK